MEKVWVLVYGLPRGGPGAPREGKLTHILKAISEPVGKLVTADLASFEDDGHARIEILCPVPAEIYGMSLIFYFVSREWNLTFELESTVTAHLHGPIPDATLPGDDGRDGNGGSCEESPFGEEDDGDGRVPPAASDGWHTQVSIAARHSGNAEVSSQVAFWTGGGSAQCGDGGVSFDIFSLARGGLLFSIVGVPFPSLGIPGSGAVAAPRLGPAGCDPEAAGSKARGEASPVVSMRQSARLSQSRLLLDGRVPTIQEKATLRAAARDLSAEVATDSGIVFQGEKCPILE
ncbi:hypothetical protein D1007_62387 [Hordeum vulgare]|nr:hypothetical protein D1007_62387 [Hordeum vulgare]